MNLGETVLITTKDLARECGVSLSTVQRALHNNGRINAETKKKILDKALELNYQPDLVARTLVSGKSMTIGMIVPFFDNQYYPRLCNSLAEQVSKQGYILNIQLHEDNKNLEKNIVSMLQGNHVDGIIFNPINKGKNLLNMIEKLHTNGCLLGLDEVENCPIPCVGNDERQAGKVAAEYIINKGYKDIVFVVPTLYDKDGQYNFGHHKRLEGILEVTGNHNIQPIIIHGTDYVQQVKNVFENKEIEKPAILCSGEVFAFKVINNLMNLGKKVRQDYGIMTFDHSELLETFNVNLTSVNNNVEEIGRQAGDIMVKMCNGEKVESRTCIDVHIVEGDTL